MPWTEAQVEELFEQVRRDFALNRVAGMFEQKLHDHGVTTRQAEVAVGKHGYRPL